ncbi:MAG: WD40 repeat domain-containing protein, partial [Planctomycetota bacterium]
KEGEGKIKKKKKKEEKKGEEKKGTKIQKKKSVQKKKLFSDLLFKLLKPKLVKGKIPIPLEGKVTISGVIGRKKNSTQVKAVYVNGLLAKLKRIQYLFSEGEEIRFEIQLDVKKIQDKIQLALNSPKQIWKSWPVKRPERVEKERFLEWVLGLMPCYHSGGITDALFTGDEKYLYTCGGEGSLQKWDLKRQIILWKAEIPTSFSSISFWGEWIVGADDKGGIHCFNQEKGKKEASFSASGQSIIKIIEVEKFLVLADSKGKIKILKKKGKKIEISREVEAHGGEILDLLWDSKKKLFYSCGSDKVLALWEWPEMKLRKKKLYPYSGLVINLSFGFRNDLFSIDNEGRILAWDSGSLEKRSVMGLLYDEPLFFTFWQNTLIMANSMGRIFLLSEKKPLFSLEPRNPLASFFPSKNKAFLAFQDGRGYWIGFQKNWFHHLQASPTLYSALAFNQKGDILGAGDNLGFITLWRFQNKPHPSYRIEKRRIDSSRIMGIAILDSQLLGITWAGRIFSVSLKKGTMEVQKISAYPLLRCKTFLQSLWVINGKNALFQ